MLWFKGYTEEHLTGNKIDLSLVDYSLINDITYVEILEYLAYCTNELGYNAATRSKYISAIEQYYEYMKRHDENIINNPTTDLSTPKLSKKLPVFLNKNEALALLKAIGEDIENPFYLRDYCIITIFLNCGLRISELVAINFKDIRNGQLIIHGKGNKERLITLNSACINAINDYVKVRPVDKVKDKDALFLSNQLKRINVRTIQYMLKKYLSKIGLDGQNISPHKLRHTFATMMFQSGQDSRTVQIMLGHENLSTTEIYTHVCQQQISDAVNSFPLADIQRNKE